MSVSDLAHELAKRCCATVPIRAYVEGLLDRLGVPAGRDPKRLQELDEIYERVLRQQLVEHYSNAELALIARTYNTPEGRSLMRKAPAFTASTTKALEAAFVAQAVELAAVEGQRSLRPDAAAGDPGEHRSP